jgi:ABC-type uncharacterized transport system YnjBCD permease subunit
MKPALRLSLLAGLAASLPVSDFGRLLGETVYPDVPVKPAKQKPNQSKNEKSTLTNKARLKRERRLKRNLRNENKE